MIRSMTGFARVEQQQDGLSLRWELRSVNHRYLDLSLRLPDAARGWEPDLRAALTADKQRGEMVLVLGGMTRRERRTST